ncbi:ER network formation protein [Paraconiothyrium brasiliense]|uniref:ER network formation protein n=1 Tax=Paraconiothyrium brasiliense TaxID=300254 RepID=A0ABR3S835_9PLEO
MERREEQYMDHRGHSLGPGSERYLTPEAVFHYTQYLQQRGQPYVPGTENATASLHRHSDHAQRRQPRLSSPIPPALLSHEELSQRLQAISTRLQTIPDPATSASTDEADNQCGICHDELVGLGADAPVAIKFHHCKHALHEKCIAEWLDWWQRNRGPLHQATCPNCRRFIFARSAASQTGRFVNAGHPAGRTQYHRHPASYIRETSAQAEPVSRELCPTERAADTGHTTLRGHLASAARYASPPAVRVEQTGPSLRVQHPEPNIRETPSPTSRPVRLMQASEAQPHELLATSVFGGIDMDDDNDEIYD